MEVARYRYIPFVFKIIIICCSERAAKINSTNGLFNPKGKTRNIEIMNRMMFTWRTND